MPKFAPGTSLGPYRVVAELGGGASGTVYLGRDTRLDRPVAIKVSKGSFDARFEREARTISSISHANICTLYDVGPDYLVMELVEGDTLATSLLHGRLPWKVVLNYAIQLADALDAAHRKGVIHRDLKPSNIKITQEGVIKVLDFGLAKSVDSPSSDSPTLTAGAADALQILGTPAYMAPEQALGRPLDKRADIWAFGVLLYEMLTGAKPFDAESPQASIARVLSEEPDFERVPGPVRPLVRRCLAKRPEDRLRDVGDARLELAELLSGSESERGPRRWAFARTPQALAVSLALLAGLAVVSAALHVSTRDSAGAVVPGDDASLPSPPVHPRIAILPCDSLSPNADDGYFAEEMHAEIWDALAQIRDIDIVSRTSVMQYVHARPAIQQIAREHNLSAVLECGVRHAGSSILVRAVLIDAATDAHLWSRNYPGDLGDPTRRFALQADIAFQIASALGGLYGPSGRGGVEAMPTASPAAYALFLEARAVIGRHHSYLREALELLDRALALDPDFAVARGYRAMLRAWTLVNSSVPIDGTPAAEIERIVLEDAARALEIDSGVAHAWLARAVVAQLTWRWHEAETAFAHAFALNPNNPEIVRFYAGFKTHTGDHEGALLLAREQATMNPHEPISQNYLSAIALRSGRVHEALAAAERALGAAPGFALQHRELAAAQLAAGQTDDAILSLRTAVALLDPAGPDIVMMPTLIVAFSSLGLDDEARRLFDEYESIVDPTLVGAGTWALLYLAVDDIDSAYEWLERARETVDRREAEPGYFSLVMLLQGRHDNPRLQEPKLQQTLERIAASIGY